MSYDRTTKLSAHAVLTDMPWILPADLWLRTPRSDAPNQEPTTLSIMDRATPIMNPRERSTTHHLRLQEHFITSSFIYFQESNMSVARGATNTTPHGTAEDWSAKEDARPIRTHRRSVAYQDQIIRDETSKSFARHEISLAHSQTQSFPENYMEKGADQERQTAFFPSHHLLEEGKIQQSRNMTPAFVFRYVH